MSSLMQDIGQLTGAKIKAVQQQLENATARPTAVAYGYDAQGSVSTITQTVAGIQRVTTLTYDAQGRVATAAYPVAGGALRTDTYQYDASGRVSGSTSVETQP